MSKKALFITLGAVAVAAAALVPYKVKTEKDEENETTTVKMRALSYSLNVKTTAKEGVDVEFKVPNIKNFNIVNVNKHIDLPKKKEEPVEEEIAECALDCENCVAVCDGEGDVDGELCQEAAECL